MIIVRKTIYEKIGGYRYKDFRNSADYEFKLRLGRTNCRVGHVRQFLVDYRYHPQGQSADRRIIRNMRRETTAIQSEYGNPGGITGKILSRIYKAKRQLEKLFLLGTLDLIPGTWHLRSHLREKSSFSSNAGLDEL
jgi:GT2 family glycosyltransferase